VDVVDVTQVGGSFVTTRHRGSCHRVGEQMGQQVMGARTGPALVMATGTASNPTGELFIYLILHSVLWSFPHTNNCFARGKI